jgi:cellulose synthase/poly-beta-1,6-N-acetylglucosamine synthase-like glycosyltransferase
MFRENLFYWIVFLVFALAAAVQLFWYLRFYLSLWRYSHPSDNGTQLPVSVIICARNESENLRNFLPAVLEQDYPCFEVIVVNDCSEDDSFDILGEYLGKYPNLKVSTVNKDPKFAHNKKFAQFIGIKAAVNELLLFTDADCRPESDQWISTMASRFTGGTDFVLGYGGYIKTKGFLNAYIRYDCMTIAMQYLGMALRGRPYMGVGRNLAYRRKVFFEKKGFSGHTHVASGDDDLFVNANSDKRNTCVEFRTEAHTRSLAVDSFGDWFNQKKRHMTTAPYYKKHDKFLITLEPVSRVLFYGTFAVLISGLFVWPYVAAIFGARLICQITVTALVQKRLNERGIAGYSLFFDILSPFINGIILLSNQVTKPGTNKWK